MCHHPSYSSRLDTIGEFEHEKIIVHENEHEKIIVHENEQHEKMVDMSSMSRGRSY